MEQVTLIILSYSYAGVNPGGGGEGQEAAPFLVKKFFTRLFGSFVFTNRSQTIEIFVNPSQTITFSARFIAL